MRLLMKTFSELHALGLFDAGLKLMLREDLRLSELNLHVNRSEGFSRVLRRVLGVFSFSIAAKCGRYQLSPRSFWSLQKEAGVYINR